MHRGRGDCAWWAWSRREGGTCSALPSAGRGAGRAPAEPTLGTSLGTWFPRVDGTVGRRAGISHGVMVTGTRMQPPCPWYLVPDTRLGGERGGWSTEIRRGPGEGGGTLSQDRWAPSSSPGTSEGPQRAPRVGDVHSGLVSPHRPTGLGTESSGHPFHLTGREAEELRGDVACRQHSTSGWDLEAPLPAPRLCFLFCEVTVMPGPRSQGWAKSQKGMHKRLHPAPKPHQQRQRRPNRISRDSASSVVLRMRT